MSWTSLINHLLHLFALPVGLGLGFVLFEGLKRAIKGKLKVTPGMALYAFVILLLGLFTQLAVLWALHQDGTVLGYASLMLVMALGHFFLTRAWKVGRA
jgi:hypothetical protein